MNFTRETIKKMNKEILMVVDAVSTEKDVAKSVIFEAIEAALARKKFMPMPDDNDIPVFPALGRSIVE